MSATDYLLWGVVAHLIADWVFQNDWIAKNKSQLFSPACFVHGAIHAAALSLIFPSIIVWCIVVLHMVIDTRIPVKLWQNTIGQTTEGPYALHVSIWLDQVFHIAVIALFALVATV